MLGVEVDYSQAWQLDKLWSNNYDKWNPTHGLVDTTSPNICMVRPKQTPDGLVITVRYSKQKFASVDAANAYSEIMEKDLTQVQTDITAKLTAAETTFQTRYLSIFGDGYKDFLKTMPDALTFGQETLAQLLGGIGYFYGPIRIQDKTVE